MTFFGLDDDDLDSSDSQPSFDLRGEGGKSEGACGDAGDDGEIRYVGDDSCEGDASTSGHDGPPQDAGEGAAHCRGC